MNVLHNIIFPKNIYSVSFFVTSVRENQSHKTFDLKRLNLVNPRKEFFEVSLEDIVEAVKGKNGIVEFTMKADAEEYRKTKAIIVENNESSDKQSSEELFEDILGVG